MPASQPGTPIDFPKSREYGSYARSARTMDLWDIFRVYDYDMGPYYCSQRSWSFKANVKLFQAVEYTTMDHSMYGEFFPRMSTIKYPNNHTGRNLLVFGDSFMQIAAQLYGSAFDNVIIFYYNNMAGVKYNEIIKQYKITDVLVTQFSERLLFNLRDDNHLGEIVID